MVDSMQEHRVIEELQLQSKPILKMGALEILLWEEIGWECRIVARLGTVKKFFRFFVEESQDSCYEYMLSELTFAHQIEKGNKLVIR